MAAIMQSMSSQKAWQVLEKNNLTTPALIEMTRDLRTNNLRKAKPEDPKKGYSGVDGARKLLNDMIEESMEKYDQEIATCTAYYSSQCAAMEGCRGQIAASNYIAANSRTLILDAQSTINRCEVDIPTRKLELLQHNEQCKVELKHMNDRLAIILADIAVMTTILEMTDCDDKKKLVQTEKLSLLRCEDPCAKGKSFVTFNHDGLKQKVAQLQSSSARNLMKDTFADMFEGVKGLEATEFVQIDAEVAPDINKTKFNNPPVPRTKVPGNPCNDKNGGAPSAADKRAAKCTIGRSPQCYKLQVSRSRKAPIRAQAGLGIGLLSCQLMCPSNPHRVGAFFWCVLLSDRSISRALQTQLSDRKKCFRTQGLRSCCFESIPSHTVIGY